MSASPDPVHEDTPRPSLTEAFTTAEIARSLGISPSTVRRTARSAAGDSRPAGTVRLVLRGHTMTAWRDRSRPNAPWCFAPDRPLQAREPYPPHVIDLSQARMQSLRATLANRDGAHLLGPTDGGIVRRRWWQFWRRR